jgi:hypothetical protein
MTRREFPRSIKVAVIRRSTRNGLVYCEACGAQAKRWQIDHVRPDGLLGEPTLANAMLICEPCWREKNPKDARDIAKAKRREARHIGAKPAPAAKIANRGFARPEKPERHEKTTPSAIGPSAIARRFGLEY